MERQPFNPYRNLKNITRFIGRIVTPDILLRQSNHYHREHFVPVEVIKPQPEQPTLWDDIEDGIL